MGKYSIFDRSAAWWPNLPISTRTSRTSGFDPKTVLVTRAVPVENASLGQMFSGWRDQHLLDGTVIWTAPTGPA